MSQQRGNRRRTGWWVAAIASAPVAGGCDVQMRPGAQTLTEALVPVGSTPIEQAVMATNKYDANQRYLGTIGLANQNFAGAPVYVQLFEKNVTDVDPMVKAAAIRGLANHGEPRHVATMAAGLNDGNILVRVEAARGLQRLHDSSAIDPLIDAMREPDAYAPHIKAEAEPEVRTEAACALGQYPENRVLRALIAALDDSDLAVNRAAQRSLRTLTGQDLGLDRNAWQQWEGSTEKPFAAQGLYTYPAYSRKQRFYEYFPFTSDPPNEKGAPPTGLPR